MCLKGSNKNNINIKVRVSQKQIKNIKIGTVKRHLTERNVKRHGREYCTCRRDDDLVDDFLRHTAEQHSRPEIDCSVDRRATRGERNGAQHLGLGSEELASCSDGPYRINAVRSKPSSCRRENNRRGNSQVQDTSCHGSSAAKGIQ